MTKPAAKVRLGGMALRNGLLVHGPTHWAAAVRTADGEIATASGPKPGVTALNRIPGVRGVVRLAEAFAVIPLVKRALPQARLPFEDVRVLGVMLGSAVAGSVIRRRVRSPIGAEAAALTASLVPALVSLRGGDLAAYHGVEHKAIAAYEQDATDVEAAKEHERCGSHLMAPLLASNLAGTAMLRRLVASPGALHSGAVALASTGIAVEVFAWSERHAGTSTSRALRRPGHEVQRLLATREPTTTQLEVGRAALAEILRVEGVGPATNS